MDNDDPLSLCLVDIDDFKRINDSSAIPPATRSSRRSRRTCARTARRSGSAATSSRSSSPDATRRAVDAAESIVDRIAALEIEHAGSITVSAGLATFPFHAAGRDELIRLTDSALYWAKEHGKNRDHVYRAGVVELGGAEAPRRRPRSRRPVPGRREPRRAPSTHATRTRAATRSASPISPPGSPTRLGCRRRADRADAPRGRLHDLGKLAIPEEILRKPGPLTDAERLVLERHPQIGYRMLESLGVDPVANWVLHHHERWDGTGYPEGLPGEQIPLGARIIFVADAYDAMTSDRVYRGRLSDEEAIEELERCAGSQFDPTVVEAFAVELGLTAVAS